MTWGRMDDKFHRNPKVRRLRKSRSGMEALGVWAFWWSWCLDDSELTGFVPRNELERIDLKHAPILVSVGLWDEVDGGYAMHDFHKYNPTREQREAKKEADRLRNREKRGDVACDSPATPLRLESDSLASRERVASTRDPNLTQPNPTQEEIAGARPATLPTEKASKPKKLSGHDAAMACPEVLDVLEHYRTVHSVQDSWKPSTKEGTRTRAEHVHRALLGEGGDKFSPEEVKSAISGNAEDPWHRERGKHEISYVLRADKVRGFLKGRLPGLEGPKEASDVESRLRRAREAYQAEDDPQEARKLRVTMESLQAELRRERMYA